MSRTRRRTGGKDRNWCTTESREWWIEHHAEYLAGEWRGIITSWHGYTFRNKWRRWEVTQYRDYDHYHKAITGKYHRDRKNYGDGVPRSFRNMLERSLRASHKHELAKAKKSGEWDAVMLPLFVHNAAWLYW